MVAGSPRYFLFADGAAGHSFGGAKNAGFKNSTIYLPAGNGRSIDRAVSNLPRFPAIIITPAIGRTISYWRLSFLAGVAQHKYFFPGRSEAP